VEDELPTWRGHNEQSMAIAAVAFAKAKHRRQIMIATSSVGPGSTLDSPGTTRPEPMTRSLQNA
jgi:TPP-dependent trihydroxycyclohexane-1,2-dione (THcHDO) dehydratase